jgi:hypothetical protein
MSLCDASMHKRKKKKEKEKRKVKKDRISYIRRKLIFSHFIVYRDNVQ